MLHKIKVFVISFLIYKAVVVIEKKKTPVFPQVVWLSLRFKKDNGLINRRKTSKFNFVLVVLHTLGCLHIQGVKTKTV